MGKKKAIKQLKKIADTLPQVLMNTTEKHFVPGSLLIAQGHTEDDGEAIDPKKIYTQSMPVQLEVNHKRRLKKFFRDHGVAGVHGYVTAVRNLKERIV